jgi:hypothetical protein
MANAANFVVTNLGDSGAGTLRQAVGDANNNGEADTITFGVSGTIPFARSIDVNAGGGALSIANTGAAGVTLSGNNVTRLFLVNAGANLTLDRLTLSGGRANGVSVLSNSFGATLTLSRCTVANNVVTIQNQPAISTDGTLNVSNSTLSNNTSDVNGGSAIFHGDGILNISSSTIANNQVGVVSQLGIADVRFKNSIIAGNTEGDFISVGEEGFTDQGTNLIGGGARVGPLQNNGGPTFTQLPLGGSGAVNTGAADEGIDQRGIPRPQGGADDIGAVEVRTPTLSIADVSVSEGNDGTIEATFTVSLSGGESTDGVRFSIATVDGQAMAPGDFTAQSLTNQTFAPGRSTYEFIVEVNGDTTFELDENFGVVVTNITGATNTSARATGTIQNDDVSTNPLVVRNTNDSGADSLRAAITGANSNPGADLITFAIAGDGPHLITLSSALPTLSGSGASTLIDGYTQPASSRATSSAPATIRIEVTGRDTRSINGLLFDAPNCVVRGLAITNFNNGVVTRWHLGDGQHGFGQLHRSGRRMASPPSPTAMVSTSDPRATRSAARRKARETSSPANSDGFGVFIFGASATGNTVLGNFIGLAADGVTAKPNSTGININSASNTVGGTSEGARNVISGNSTGVVISGTSATGNTVSGNFIAWRRMASPPSPIARVSTSLREQHGRARARGARNVISGNTNGVSSLAPRRRATRFRQLHRSGGGWRHREGQQHGCQHPIGEQHGWRHDRRRAKRHLRQHEQRRVHLWRRGDEQHGSGQLHRSGGGWPHREGQHHGCQNRIREQHGRRHKRGRAKRHLRQLAGWHQSFRWRHRHFGARQFDLRQRHGSRGFGHRPR